MAVNEMVEAVRAHAKANYAKARWDYVVECYTWQDIANIVMFCTTADEAIAEVLKDVNDTCGTCMMPFSLPDLT